MTDTIIVLVDTTHTEISLEQEISVLQLSMLAIVISDILHRELYALPYDG